jgi:hypothetical protein
VTIIQLQKILHGSLFAWGVLKNGIHYTHRERERERERQREREREEYKERDKELEK